MDKICQNKLHCFMKNFLYLFLVWDYDLGWPFWKERNSTAILLADHGRGRQRGLQPYLHTLEVLKWLISVNKHSPWPSKTTCRLRVLKELPRVKKILSAFSKGVQSDSRDVPQREFVIDSFLAGGLQKTGKHKSKLDS